MIFLLGIHVPDVFFLKGGWVDHGFDGIHRGEHGVVHVVIAVLAVTTDAVEVGDGVKVLSDLIDVFVGIEIGRIGFLDLDFGRVQNVFFVDDVDGG